MSKFFAPNIDRKGRLFRGGLGLAMVLAGAVFGFTRGFPSGAILILAGGFALLEAVRGWCFARACGIKTRM